MKKDNIMVVTTGRADYGLLRPLIKRMLLSNHFDMRLIATGAHLSPLHGQTIQLIENDGLEVMAKVQMTMPGDTEGDICASISAGLSGFSELFDQTTPDLVVVLGDRYELWSICIPAVIHRIPIAHIHGGESTLGVIDDPVRHSITKMSTFHFASIDKYATRLIQMGERPERVHVVGAIGLDNLRDISLMSRKELSEYAGVDFSRTIALATYHPVTLDNYESAKSQVQEILNALLETDLTALVTMPNSDRSWNTIYREIHRYSQRYPDRFKLLKNLGQRAYLSAMKYASLMVGNSSSGIIESASFELPVVNIGDRQAGRVKPPNVIDCICSRESVHHAIDKALSPEFKRTLSQLENPYGDGNTSTRILKILESIDFADKSAFLKKGFYDLNCEVSQIALQG